MTLTYEDFSIKLSPASSQTKVGRHGCDPEATLAVQHRFLTEVGRNAISQRRADAVA